MVRFQEKHIKHVFRISKKKCKSETMIYKTAQQNAENTIKGLVEPFVRNAETSEDHYKVKSYNIRGECKSEKTNRSAGYCCNDRAVLQLWGRTGSC